jgi:hypothetical protein
VVSEEDPDNSNEEDDETQTVQNVADDGSIGSELDIDSLFDEKDALPIIRSAPPLSLDKDDNQLSAQQEFLPPDLSFLSVPPDTELVSIYRMKQILIQGEAKTSPIIVKSFTSLSTANKFCCDELQRHRWGRDLPFAAMNYRINRQGCANGSAFIDDDEKNGIILHVCEESMFKKNMDAGQRRTFKTNTPSRMWIVFESTKKNSRGGGKGATKEITETRTVGLYSRRSLACDRAAKVILDRAKPDTETNDERRLAYEENIAPAIRKYLHAMKEEHLDADFCFDDDEMLGSGVLWKVWVDELIVQGPLN